MGAVQQLLEVLQSQDIEENEVTVTIAARVSAFLCELGKGPKKQQRVDLILTTGQWTLPVSSLLNILNCLKKI